VLADMLDGRADTRPGLMFGFPAFYAAGKLVAAGVAALGAVMAAALLPAHPLHAASEPTPEEATAQVASSQ